MKKQGKAIFVLNVLGIALSRAAFMGINPIAMGFFGAAYAMKKGRIFTVLAVCLGMIGVLPIVDYIKYIIIMLVAMIIAALVESKNSRVSPMIMGIIVGLSTLCVSCSSAYLYHDLNTQIYLCVMEGIIAFVFSNVFYRGIDWLLTGKGRMLPSNEQILSMGVMIGFIVYAMKNVPYVDRYAGIGLALFVVLYVGYKYGAGFGTVIGAVSGVALSVWQKDYTLIGIMCLLGLVIGVFRELGRFLTAVAYAAAVICVAVVFKGYFYQIDVIESMLGAIAVFLLLPGRMAKRIDVALDTGSELQPYAKDNIQSITKTKLKEFSQSFYQLSHTFQEITKEKDQTDKNQIREVMEDLSSQFCSRCTKCDTCWKKNYSDTYSDMEQALITIADQGYIQKTELPETFTKRCIMVNSFMNESARLFEVARLNQAWKSRLAESREAIAGQLSEVASIIDEFSEDLYCAPEACVDKEAQLKYVLKANHILVTQLVILETHDKRQQVYMIAKAEKGQCITVKEVAAWIGDTIGKPMRPVEGTKNVITKVLDTFAFTEDTTFKVLTGMSRMTKQGEKISGDNFSFLNLESGEMIMSLSDGMGTGIDANEESESVIELLEQFLGAGFHEESAIRLINSILVLRNEEQSFSTIDLSIINLFTGVCEFVKIGASSSFIRRDNWVETISSTTMPVGVFNQVDFDQKSKKLYDGDFVVMMTDGVLDCIKGNEKEKFIQTVLLENQTNNPQEIASKILSKALEENDNVPVDDMTVLVAGLWKK